MSFSKQLKIVYFLLAGALVLGIGERSSAVPVLADTIFLKSLGINTTLDDSNLQISFAEITEEQAEALSMHAHAFGKCGGFERLRPQTDISGLFSNLSQLRDRARTYTYLGKPLSSIERKQNIEEAIKMISVQNLQETVRWLSQFPTRYHKGKSNNIHVEQLAEKIKPLLKTLNYPATVEFISHLETPQKSLRIRLVGSQRPQEIVALGGHLDSIANWGRGQAPGADDNASGSANVLEVLRVLLTQPQPERTIDLFWYAGEEAGLIGSSEIAETYRNESIDVVGVMQLDMTLFPGEGELIMGDMSDYTNPWLRNYMRTLSDMYVGARWKEDQCGYGCSDHASWYRQGYPTVMPFEATMNTMNDDIHTTQDVISPRLSFKHSEAFAKLALAFVMDLSNSTLRDSF